MDSLQKLRKVAYWGLDFIKGSPVQKHYKEVSEILQNPGSEFALAKQAQALHELLKYTVNTIPYYREMNFPLQLENFPIVNKNLIRNQQDKFLSSKYSKQKLLQITTSGSTGTPFTVYQNKNKKNRNVADVLFFAKLAEYELGNTLYYMRWWDENLSKSKLLAFLQNIIPVQVLDMNDAYIEDLLTILKKDTSKKGFIGYASYYTRIVNYMQRTLKSPRDYNIKSIIAISETLPKETKEQMEYYFNCPVVSRYSNMENGILAQQLPNKGCSFMVNTASYKVEIINLETNEPVKDGQLGKIVVTDLYNYAMPLIRYDTGDVGALEKDLKKGYTKFTRIDGRQLDVIMNTKGEILNSFVSMFIIRYPGILQTQMIQEGRKEYKFKLCVTNDFNSEEAIKNHYLKTLGQDAIITFQYVNEIPLLRSGKHKMMVNNYLKNLNTPKNT